MKFTGLLATALSVGSAFAAPAPVKKADALTQVVSLVSGLKADVTAELSGLPLVGNLTIDVVPEVQATLKQVVTLVEGVTGQIVPLVLGLAVPTVEAEVQAVVNLVGEVKDTVSGVESSVKQLVGVATKDVVALIQPEIQAVFQVAGPLVTPVTSLAFGVVSALPGGSALVSDLLNLTGDLQKLTASLLAPVDELLAGLGL